MFFDTFAEDASLYLISYFDKHLEMFNDLFYLSKGRNKIYHKMKQVDELSALGIKYKAITESNPFRAVKEIRDNFVHNKSSSYYGMDVTGLAGGVYVSCNAKGISTHWQISTCFLSLWPFEGHSCVRTSFEEKDSADAGITPTILTKSSLGMTLSEANLGYTQQILR